MGGIKLTLQNILFYKNNCLLYLKHVLINPNPLLQNAGGVIKACMVLDLSINEILIITINHT